jgi:hypothetical protein
VNQPEYEAIRLDTDVDRPALKEALAASHKNIRGLATAALISQDDVSLWINGQIALSIEQVTRIEKALDVEGMFTGGLNEIVPAAHQETSPAVSEAEPVDERELATATSSADAPVPADDVSAAGEPAPEPAPWLSVSVAFGDAFETRLTATEWLNARDATAQVVAECTRATELEQIAISEQLLKRGYINIARVLEGAA